MDLAAPPVADGALDEATRTRVAGWARDPAAPDLPVPLLVIADDRLLARVLADRARPDLREAGIGHGRHGFDVALTGLSPAEPQLVAVRRERDGAHLAGSPVLLQPVQAFDAAFRAHCVAVLANAADDAALTERLGFLAAQAEALLGARSERRSRGGDRAVLRQLKWRWTGRAAAAPTALPLRALVVDEHVPSPSRDAGSNAILSHMRALMRLGFEVSFAAADMAADHAGVLAADGITCCHAPWHGSVEEVLRREAGCFDLVYLHRATVAARYLGLVAIHQPKARLVYGVADLHHLRLARQAEVEQRPELLPLARRFFATEMQAAAAAHAVVTHSSHEAALIRRHVPDARVHVVPWAVPVRPTWTPFAARAGVGFLGHYGHPPNLDAAQFLVDDIMPLVRATHPGIGCLLAGSELPDVLRAKRPGIVALGPVEALPQLFGRVRLTVAPMNFGAGIKGKVLESLAAGVPCLCSPVAAEGLDLPPPLSSLVAADAAGLAAGIVRLHEDAAWNGTCREAGLAYAAAMLSQTRVVALMRDVAGLPPAQPGLAEAELPGATAF